MSKVIDCKIYKLDYLINSEYTDDDLHNLFDENSLLYSLVINMFRYAGYKMSREDIISEAKNNSRWMYEYFWTQKQHDEYIDIVKKIYKNLYQYSEDRSLSMAQWWVFYYGLTIKRN